LGVIGTIGESPLLSFFIRGNGTAMLELAYD
jgi:hypothetical protein